MFVAVDVLAVGHRSRDLLIVKLDGSGYSYINNAGIASGTVSPTPWLLGKQFDNFSKPYHGSLS